MKIEKNHILCQSSAQYQERTSDDSLTTEANFFASERWNEEFTIRTPMVQDALRTVLRGCPPPRGGPDLLKILDDDSWHVLDVDDELLAVDDESLSVSRLTEADADVGTDSDSQPKPRQVPILRKLYQEPVLRQKPCMESGQLQVVNCARRKGSHSKRMPQDFLEALKRSQRKEGKKKRKERFQRLCQPEHGVSRKSHRRRSCTP